MNWNGTRTTTAAPRFKWNFTAQYDHFFTKKWYYGGVVELKTDKNADLNLRSRFGPLLGYQWFESRDLNLSTQAGPMRVREDFDTQEDNNYWAAYWEVGFDKYLFADIMQFYHRHWGIWNVEETDDLVMDSWTGLRFPLQAGFVASTELRAEYDRGAAKDRAKHDTTYRLKLGYAW